MSWERLTAISLAYVITVASIAGVLLAFGPGVAAANHGGTPYAVGQDGQCVTEIHPLGDGTTTGPAYYDYAPLNYSSLGTTDIQQTGLSQFYVYSGSDGTSLVFLHNRYKPDQVDGDGGAVSLYFDGLPSSGAWTVEDDDYLGQDDRGGENASSKDFDREAVHWMYGRYTTDGGVFLGLGEGDWSEITIDGDFAGDAWANDSNWEYRNEGPNEWITRSADGTTTQLNMAQPVSLREGGCDAVSPTADLSGPANASTNETVTLEASAPDSPTTPIEYRWDFQNDGDVDTTTTSTAVEHAYADSGQVTAAVTVVDRFGGTETATTTISIEEPATGNEPPTAVASVPASATVGENVTVDGSASTDDEGIVSHEWDFGDGTTATGATASHAYGEAGNYTVTLTVTDGDGANDTATGSIEVQEAPPENQAPTVELTADPASVTAGGDVTLSANASDPDDDSLTYTWSKISGASALDLPDGPNGTVTPSEAGTYEVGVTVEDTAGANVADSVTFEVEETQPSNQPPSADFDWSPTSPTPGETVTFDASNASDPDGNVTGYAWDVDGDGTADAGGAQATHEFASAGSYDVTLTVTDEDGANDSATRSVTVEVGNAAPTVALSADPTAVAVGGSVNLTATASDSDGDRLTYTWQTVSGPGSLDLPSGSDGSVTPTEGGTYEVRVTVEDDAGASDSATVTFEAVETNAAPTAAFEWTPTNPETGQSVTFDASNSSDGDGSVASYAWDFDGDEQDDATGKTVEHTFASAGDRPVTLRVTDGEGANATTTQSVSVAEGTVGDGNQPPTAALDANETPVAPGDAVALDATGSTDPDGDELSYAWRVVSAPSGTNVTPPSGESGEVTLPTAGEYTFEVTVDDGNATDAATATVTVAEENEAPTAAFGWSPTEPIVGETVSLDASGSADADGSIAGYAWDVGADGSYEETTVAPTLTFASAGSHDVALRVTDDRGATDTVTRTVHVVEADRETNQPPEAVLQANHTSLTVTEPVALDASSSSDPDGADDALAFNWTVTSAPEGARLPSFHAAPKNEVSFEEAGTYEVRVTVEDGDGGTDSATETIEVTAKPFVHVHDVSIEDDTVEVEEKTEFDVTLHNAGYEAGEKTLEVVVGGEVVAQRTVEVGPRQEESFTLVHCFERPGNYAATVAGESFDVTVSAPDHDLRELSIAGGDGATLDAGSPDSVTVEATLVVESDVVTETRLTAAIEDLDSAEFDATVGTGDAPVTNVSAGEPQRQNSTWAIPLALEVDAPSLEPGTYDLQIASDLPSACWPIADSDCGATSELNATSGDAVVYEAADPSRDGSTGWSSGDSGSQGGSISAGGGSSSDTADQRAKQTTATGTASGDQDEATPRSVTQTSVDSATPVVTEDREQSTAASTPDPTETDAPGQPGFGVVLALLAILAAILLVQARS